MLQFAKRSLMAGLCCLTLTSCVTSLEKGVEEQPTAAQDAAFNTSYEQNTRSFEMITNFETKYIVHATLLTANFRKALADRYQRIFNEAQPVLEETASKTGFFVTIYTANGDVNELGDERFWNIQLKQGNEWRKASIVRQLQPKERWQPFFKDITPWSKEYLIIFDATPAVSQEGLVAANSLSLILNSPDGRVTATW